MILNVVLLIIGFFTCGREFGAKTVYTSVLLEKQLRKVREPWEYEVVVNQIFTLPFRP